jgi:hypothetical protein
MFRLREITKIRLCRAAFFAVCLAPTLAVLAWSVTIRLPEYRQAHERAIGALLGLEARLTRVSSPRPDTTLYEWLELWDPDRKQLLARLPLVEVRDEGDRQLSIELPLPAIANGLRLDAFCHLAQEELRTSRGPRRLRLAAPNLTLHYGDGDLTFTELEGELENTAEWARARASFRRAQGDTTFEPGELSIVDRREGDAVGRAVHFTTGAVPLACSAGASLWPALKHLGKASQFQGHLSWSDVGGRRKAELRGQFTAIDLDRLVTGQLPYKLSGRADLELERMTLDDGRIETATGTLVAGPGTISRALVRSAETHLGIQAAASAAGAGNPLAYSRLGIAFDIGADGLALGGAADKQGSLLVHGQKVLALAPASRQPALNLVRTLAPQTHLQVPAARETELLTRALPLPSAMVSDDRQDPPKAKSVRLPERGTTER